MWIFFIFWISKIRVNPTGIVSSISPHRCHLSTDRYCHAAATCHTFFPLSQDELGVFVLSSDNASFRCLPSRAETKALNLHHHRRLPFPNLPTPTLHNCKKSISTLITLPTTQLCLHLAFSLARASHHQSSARHHCSLSQLSHVHRPFA
jgi:hypothetical protein